MRISEDVARRISTDFPPGSVALPGFVDPHLHLLAMAARRFSVDCSVENAPTISHITDLIRARARVLPVGMWVRAEGYEEIYLDERRHPTRAELDAAAPDHPVLLHHRAGHVVVANARALRMLGFSDVELDVDGDPSVRAGLLVGAELLLDDRVPRPARDELVRAVEAASREMAEAGVTACTDATVTNGLDRYDFLRELTVEGVILQRLVVMPGIDHLADFVEAGLNYGSGDRRCHVGHAKVVPPDDVDVAELRDQVRAAHDAGWPVAIHVVDIDQLDAALGAIEASPAPNGERDRLEHNALSLPEQVERIAKSGAAVVTQPSFLLHRARRYAEELSPVEQDWLYRVGSLVRAGVTVAGSSDAPVAPARPLEVAMAATSRGGGAGPVFAPSERVDGPGALALITSAAVAVGPGLPGEPGGNGDVTVLSSDPFELDNNTGTPGEVSVLATFVAGELIFRL